MKMLVPFVSKISITAVILLLFSLNLQAQLGKKKKSNSGTEGTPPKTNPVITSPTAGSVIDGPFVLVGKAEPNSYLNLRVSPIYKLPSDPSGKPTLRVSTPAHEPQEFNVKTNEKGVWQSPVIEVLFDSKATDQRIFAFVYQQWGSQKYESKTIEYRASPKLSITKLPLKTPATKP